jgi:hypothetical protein
MRAEQGVVLRRPASRPGLRRPLSARARILSPSRMRGHRVMIRARTNGRRVGESRTATLSARRDSSRLDGETPHQRVTRPSDDRLALLHCRRTRRAGVTDWRSRRWDVLGRLWAVSTECVECMPVVVGHTEVIGGGETWPMESGSIVAASPGGERDPESSSVDGRRAAQRRPLGHGALEP